DVADGFLAEIMIDAIDLALLEHLQELAIERARRCEIGAERLLHDHASPSPVLCPVLLARQSGSAEMAADRREGLGRRRQIEQAVASGPALPLDAIELLAQPLIGLRVVAVARQVADAVEQPPGDRLVDLAGGKLAQALLELVAERLARLLGA